MLSKIYNLLDYCYKDNSCDKLPDIKLQLFLIGVKSIIPLENDIGCMFDISRYEREMDLFNCYKNGHDDSLEYYFLNKEPWDMEDHLLEFKIIPIIVANTQWDILINEAIKVGLFFSKNKNTILNTIVLASAITEYLNNDNYIENFNEVTKERLISFSLKEFLSRNNLEFNKGQLIEFEKERIKLLTKEELITDDMLEKFNVLKFIFNKDSILSEKTNETVLSSFSLYLFKLRKGIIDPEKLKIPQGNIPNIKEFLKYSSFSHPLLGRCKVLKRGDKEVILQNKSGLIKVNL